MHLWRLQNPDYPLPKDLVIAKYKDVFYFIKLKKKPDNWS